jgi:hypothetical protein
MKRLLLIAALLPLAGESAWWQIDALRARLGAGLATARLLGHDFGPDEKRPDYAFLAAKMPGEAEVTRSLVVLPLHGRKAQITFDVVKTDKTTTSLRCAMDDGSAVPPADGEIGSIDFGGVRLDGWVLLFYTEINSARSPVSFNVKGAGTLRFLLGGLAPGTWEIWRNGWLEDPSGTVDRTSGALYFEGPAGEYFLRRL